MDVRLLSAFLWTLKTGLDFLGFIPLVYTKGFNSSVWFRRPKEMPRFTAESIQYLSEARHIKTREGREDANFVGREKLGYFCEKLRVTSFLGAWDVCDYGVSFDWFGNEA